MRIKWKSNLSARGEPGSLLELLRNGEMELKPPTKKIPDQETSTVLCCLQAK